MLRRSSLLSPARRLVCLAAGSMLWAFSVLAFAYVPVGTVVENVPLPSLPGGEEKLLSDTNVSVFIFIKPGLEHSRQALTQIAELEKDMAEKPVHWCAIVSDRVAKADVEAEIQTTGLRMSVLIDRGDVLFGRFGVVLLPSIGITDQNGRLAAYQPFTKVNYGAVIRAQIRHALKEISDQELEETLKPPPAALDENVSIARRFFRLAEKQFQSTNYDQALSSIQKSLEKNPAAAAYTLQGRILMAEGKPEEAQSAFEDALKLDPQDPIALERVKNCKATGTETRQSP